MTDEQQNSGQHTTPQQPVRSGQPPQIHHHGRRPHRHFRDHSPRPMPAQQAPSEAKTGEEEKPLDIDEDETEEERSRDRGRPSRRGGKPPKKIIEEWANDPYCE